MKGNERVLVETAIQAAIDVSGFRPTTDQAGIRIRLVAEAPDDLGDAAISVADTPAPKTFPEMIDSITPPVLQGLDQQFHEEVVRLMRIMKGTLTRWNGTKVVPVGPHKYLVAEYVRTSKGIVDLVQLNTLFARGRTLTIVTSGQEDASIVWTPIFARILQSVQY
jgi:hypothetical protein